MEQSPLKVHPLLTPFRIGDLELRNRVILAPMSRRRCDVDGIPNDLLVEYYASRASAGLLITECTAISEEGQALPCCAAIYTNEQEAGWKNVVDEVHKRGGRIFMQLWHGGRAVHPIDRDGRPSISASAVPIRGNTYIHKVPQPHAVPKEATIEDIKRIVADFKEAAVRAKRAGFDGVQL